MPKERTTSKRKQHIRVIMVSVLILLLAGTTVYAACAYHDALEQRYQSESLIYRGILANNDTFSCKQQPTLTYDFDCPEYSQLLEKYVNKRIKAEDSDLDKAVDLMQYYAPKMSHLSDYDGHIKENSLDLLSYSLKGNGINCRGKSKILCEMYLALGIPARRIWLMPYSQEDPECHVVVEIYDKGYDKWIMLDTTNNLYFVDKDKIPLSALEIRKHLLEPGSYSIVYCGKQNIFDDIYDDYTCYNDYVISYYSKNTAYIEVEGHSSFGIPEDNRYYYLLPDGFNLLNLSEKEMISAEALYAKPESRIQ